MSNRRMFSNRIANSARFLKMPIESQLLYFHFVLRADDDGVVEAYPIIELLGIKPDAISVLIIKGFIRQLNDDQVILIEDWIEHNKIRADRKVDSIYKKLLLEKFPDIALIEPRPRSDVVDNSKRVAKNINLFNISKEKSNGPSTDRISKVRLGKLDSDQNSQTKKIPTDKEDPNLDLIKNFNLFWETYPKHVNKKKAMASFSKINPELLPAMLKAIEEQKKSKQWQDPQYIPHPTTWLNQERWEDEGDKITPEQEIKRLIEEMELKFGKDKGCNIALFRWEKICNERGLDFSKYYKLFPNA